MMMVKYVSSDQVSESAADQNIRRKVLPSGHAANANAQSETMSINLDWSTGVFGRNHLGKGPCCHGMAGWEGTIGFVLLCTMRPEISPSVAFVGALTIGRKLQLFYDEQRIDNRLFSQASGF
jgi:hypothetical protein